MTTIEKVKKWVRENGSNGSHYAGGETIFEDQFHGLRKILGMPTSERGICKEWNDHHKSK